MTTEILNHKQIELKLDRLAFEIFEKNHEAENILLVGIAPRGTKLATLIKERLELIMKKNVDFLEIILDKENPKIENLWVDKQNNELQNTTVILCDDVLYTGRTLTYACFPFLENNVKSIQCLVLVNRNHKTFPISPIFVGLELSTTRAEHVSVELNEKYSVRLN